MVVASNCGSEAFQKKLNTVITSASDQKPSLINTPAKVMAASREPMRMISMRLPV